MTVRYGNKLFVADKVQEYRVKLMMWRIPYENL
jgi:hypothetical protein